MQNNDETSLLPERSEPLADLVARARAGVHSTARFGPFYLKFEWPDGRWAYYEKPFASIERMALSLVEILPMLERSLPDLELVRYVVCVKPPETVQ